ncbi:MAG TPA: hypothetical protein VJV39_26540, partial [Dongiaceae bacterium]|nr:hypothetical protein [Dongiaceae bacterium]
MALASGMQTATAWEFAHGDRDNSGFANVTTAPARGGSVSVPGLGRFALGAGPVIAPDGTVYVGTVGGKLTALHADGSKFWSRDITPGESIVASPAISSDGSVYVIGVKTATDESVNPPVTTVSSTLHRFNNSGAWLSQTPLPDDRGAGPAAFAPPMIWRSGGAEAIMIPIVYRHKYGGGHTLQLFALSLTGQVLASAKVGSVVPQIVGGTGRPGWVESSCLVPVLGWPLCLGGKAYDAPPHSGPFGQVSPV